MSSHRTAPRVRRAWLAAVRLVALVATVLVVSACTSDDTALDDDGLTADTPSADATDDEATAPDAAGGPSPVAIPTADLDLQGSLRLPAGDGPHPAVVIAHGSGPHSRDGALPGQLGLTLPRTVPVYQQLAEGLTERGYATLTWDKRTCGPFNGCGDNDYPVPPDDLTIGTLADDIAAAADLLASRADVAEVVLLGHSKGGTMVLDVGARHDGLAALVLVATPLSPIDEVLADQADTFARLVEVTGQTGTPAADQQVAALRTFAEDVAALRTDGDADAPATIGGASAAFWRSWLELSDATAELVEQRDVPMLVLGGEQDWNVQPDQVRAFADHLRDDDTVEILDAITHALTRLDEPDPAAIRPGDLGTAVEPVVIDTIAGWLDVTLGR